MKIDLTKYKMGHWFEDEEGNVYEPMKQMLPKDKNYFTYHTINTCAYSHTVDSYTHHPEFLHEGNSFYHAMLAFKWFRNLMIKRMQKRGEAMTFKRAFSSNVHYGSGDVIVAMVNSGDYTLGEAIYVYCNACERCMNVLTYKYLNGADGYAEYSDDWKKCNTVCKWCEGEKS